MYQPEAILEGARAIRPHLAELLGAEAEGVDRALARLVAEAEEGRKVDSNILDLLARRDATRVWMEEFLEGAEGRTAAAPQIDTAVGEVIVVEPVGPKGAAPPGGRVRGFSPPPGRADPIAAQRYVCPNGDYEWYRQRVGTPVPECPTHHLPLEPAEP